MTGRASALHGRLPAIEQQRAEGQTALIAALNQREVEDMRTSTRAASTRDRRGAAAWIHFETARGPVLIAPLLVDSQLARMTSGPGVPDGAAAAAALGRIEPLVVAVETILGLELHPAGLVQEPQGDMLLIRLDAHGKTGVRHRLLIAIPTELEIEPLPLPAELPARIGALALRWSIAIDLPPIRAARLATLATGDCILLGIGTVKGRLILPGRRDRATVIIDFKGGNATLDRLEGDANVSDRISRLENAPSPAGHGPAWADLKIAATIEVDGGRLTAAQMATLGEGSVLPLPTVGGVLAVRVLVEGDRIAEGELVAVGDGFGILVTALAAQTPPAQTPPVQTPSAQTDAA